MNALIDYKCPACNGSIEFDSQTQQMKCPYCDTLIDVESLQKLDAKIDGMPEENMSWNTEDTEYMSEDESAGLNVYSCRSCGGEVVADETTAATRCPFCDNNIVMTNRFAGDLKPNLLIPFHFDKKQAKEALKNHVNKRFVPSVFKEENHIEEIQGVYVPVWLFDSDVDAQIIFNGEIIRTYSDSDYDYTETSVYQLNRSGNVGFSAIPVDGSTKMDDDLMESVEPFDLNGSKDFQTAFLSGYLANRYDVDMEQCFQRANERIRYSTEEVFRDSTAGYSNVHVQNSHINLFNNTYKYALYPVWLLNTRWNDQNFAFAMNGQTGKFVGNLPLDKNKYRAWFSAITMISAVVIYAIAWMLR